MDRIFNDFFRLDTKNHFTIQGQSLLYRPILIKFIVFDILLCIKRTTKLQVVIYHTWVFYSS